MVKKSYVSQEALFKYLQQKRGISQSLSKMLVKDIVDFIVCSLCLKDKVGVADLGTFTLIPNPNYGARIKYRPHRKLKEIVKSYILEKRQKVSDKDEEDLVTFTEEEDYPITEWKVDLSSEDIGHKEGVKGNIVRRSLLLYLKKEFPHGEDWKHPVSNHFYSFDLIKEKLEFYRNNCPENYSLLWSLWLSQRSRIVLAEQYKLSASSVNRKWSDAIDCILNLIQFPELEPEVISSLYD